MSYTNKPLIDDMVSLKVENISFLTTQDLNRVFRVYREIGDIYIPRCKYSRESRGYVFVRYYDERDAYDAIHYLNHTKLDGRMISVKMARYRTFDIPN
ncbi:serine/arginine-rich splicing factor 2-like [Rhopalosiphum maidis]|uniref:serine/arginine-rich splicing factor 2-like n=1 Tax=Rhopalosiphum maidis TaxID=43146 RepID=UPI000EFE4CC3|nr:serine/arginine-rich splicing factor 2-like [Rhopalosiphum maidis]